MLVVVGGHSRNIGKTSVVEGLISSLRNLQWTAVKITQHGHGICSVDGHACECAIDCGDPFRISEEAAPSTTDSGRFLAAGAARSYWLRTPVGKLSEAMPELRRILASHANVILESNSVLEFVDPDFYVVVIDGNVDDVKNSTRRFAHRANAFVAMNASSALPEWAAAKGKPVFHAAAPDFLPEELVELVRPLVLQR
jgi:molybdopterin-guanine dinucleotide biosynthesis protein